MEAALADGTARRVTDEVFWRKDGTSFAVEIRHHADRENGAIIGAVVVFQMSPSASVPRSSCPPRTDGFSRTSRSANASIGR